MTFNECNNLRVENMKFKNAQQMHIRFQHCNNVGASNLIVKAPGHSPNTDGIHVTHSQNVIISNSIIGTGKNKKIKKCFKYIIFKLNLNLTYS